MSPLLHCLLRLSSLNFKNTNIHDPSPFLHEARTVIKREYNSSFNLNKQQVAAEILTYILNFLCKDRLLFNKFFSVSILNQLACLFCGHISSTEEKANLLQIPLHGSIPLSIVDFLKEEKLVGDNRYYCSSCETNQDASRYYQITNLGAFLILQVKRFSADGSCKRHDFVKCFPEVLKIPVSVDKVTIIYHYKLNSVINHLGSLNSGHYTASVSAKDKWFLCDDQKISEITTNDLQNGNSYIFFYRRIVV